jgi:hypothetical protein
MKTKIILTSKEVSSAELDRFLQNGRGQVSVTTGGGNATMIWIKWGKAALQIRVS